ncbi:hypothetical protein, partial [Klebsiella pneumoniae]|uniref:hypothetical protein n=1 Tax=Klebsiella pneumoniae TaxID=573 RepID=UPI001D0ED488
FNNDSASTTRCSTGRASTVFSICSIADMLAAYFSRCGLASRFSHFDRRSVKSRSGCESV